MDMEQEHDSLLGAVLAVVLVSVICMVMALQFVKALDSSAVIAEREAKAKQRGRIEMLAEVNAAFEKEGRTLETYYRWASRKGTTGFDGLALAERQ